MRNRIISVVAASLAVMFLIWNFYLMTVNQADEQVRQKRQLALQELTVYGDRLQNIVNVNLQYVDFLELLILNNHDITTYEFKPYAEMILEQSPVIRSIALSPDGIVSIIFPLEDNEAAVGLDLLADVTRKKFVEEAINTRESVSQGPVQSSQGGYIIYNRKAVFTAMNIGTAFERPVLWGLATIALDFEEIIRQTRMSPELEGFQIALRARRTDGINDFYWGESEIFKLDPLVRTIKFPNQSWELAIYPDGGWLTDFGEENQQNLVIYVILALAIFAVVYHQANRYQEKIQQARKDPLTGTLNKNAFRSYVRRQLKHRDVVHAVCVMDLNNFKEINDTMGHPAGDAILIELAKRIRQRLRHSDQISRFGGDEFIIFLNNVEDKDAVEQILFRINNKTSAPINICNMVPGDENHPSVSMQLSIGYALAPDEGATYEELYALADKRMYEHKAAFKRELEHEA